MTSLCRYAFNDQKNYDAAILYLNKSIELDANNAATYISRGHAYFNHKNRNLKAAIQDFNKAIELDPNNYLPYYNRGIALDEEGDYEQAIRDYDMTINLNPRYNLNYCDSATDADTFQ